MSRCGICWDSGDDLINLPCNHKCCKDCLQHSIKADIDTPRRPQCPCCLASGQMSPITFKDHHQTGLSKDILEAMLRVEGRIQSKIVCESCHTLTNSFDSSGRLTLKCQTCGQNPRGVTQSFGDDMFIKYFEDQGGLWCKQCNAPVVKDGGCDHVMCLCGYGFWWSQQTPIALVPLPSPITKKPFWRPLVQCFSLPFVPS